MRVIPLIGVLLAVFITPSAAETLTFKCSFGPPVPADIVYVVNSDAKDVAIVGGFGTHKGFVLSYNTDFFYVIEPNAGASVATVLFFKANEIPVGIRTTLGKITEEQYQGMPTSVQLSSDKSRFMAVASSGRCPIQR